MEGSGGVARMGGDDNRARRQRQQGRQWCLGTCPSLACAMAVAAAARTLVHVEDGDRAGDDASASSPVPCLPT
jgi:hypothetical protein